MVDRATMNGLRGFDEGISFARLHLDSRFCYNAMAAVWIVNCWDRFSTSTTAIPI